MNKNDIATLNSLAEIIRKEGSITKGMLYKKSNIGIWRFRELVRFLPDIYEDIHYNKLKQTYDSTHTLTLFTKEQMK